MEKISDRLQIIAKNEGISIRNLEQRIGCSNGVLSKSILKGTDISSLWLSKIIEAFPHYSAAWLLTGIGSQISVQKNEEIKCLVKNCDFMEMIEKKDKKIEDMAKEIGRLEQQVVTLKKGGSITSYNMAAEP